MVLRLAESIHNPLPPGKKKREKKLERHAVTSHTGPTLSVWKSRERKTKTQKESSGITNTILFSKSPSQQDHTRALCKPKMGVRALIMHCSMG